MSIFSRNPIRVLGIGLALFMVLIFVTACSVDHAPMGSGGGSDATVDMGDPYPPLTPDILARGPAAGYKFVTIPAASSVLDALPCNKFRASRWCMTWTDQSVKIERLVEVRINRYRMPFDNRISIVAPQGCLAVADFYPHPFQFRGTVEIRWQIGEMGFPRDFDFDSLIPWYITDEGEYVPMPYEWRDGHDELVVFTDHFSRYILGARATK